MLNYITPVMYADSTGYFALTTLLICGAIGALIGGGAGVYIGYQVTGEFSLEYAITGAMTGALIISGGYLAFSSIASASAMLLGSSSKFTSIGISIYLGFNGAASAIAQYQANEVNGSHPYKGVMGSFVGGVLGAGYNPISPLIAGFTSSMINEFENKLLFDYVNPNFSWSNILRSTKNYSIANYSSYVVSMAFKFNPFTAMFSNYLSDLMVYILEERRG